jgi:hypothetical protein
MSNQGAVFYQEMLDKRKKKNVDTEELLRNANASIEPIFNEEYSIEDLLNVSEAFYFLPVENGYIKINPENYSIYDKLILEASKPVNLDLISTKVLETLKAPEMDINEKVKVLHSIAFLMNLILEGGDNGDIKPLSKAFIKNIMKRIVEFKIDSPDLDVDTDALNELLILNLQNASIVFSSEDNNDSFCGLTINTFKTAFYTDFDKFLVRLAEVIDEKSMAFRNRIENEELISYSFEDKTWFGRYMYFVKLGAFNLYFDEKRFNEVGENFIPMKKGLKEFFAFLNDSIPFSGKYSAKLAQLTID